MITTDYRRVIRDDTWASIGQATLKMQLAKSS